MAANNWSNCENCRKIAEQNRDERIATVKARYGVMPPEEFVSEMAKAEKLPEPRQTKREDYEFWVNEVNQFNVQYRESCAACGFAFSYAATVPYKNENERTAR